MNIDKLGFAGRVLLIASDDQNAVRVPSTAFRHFDRLMSLQLRRLEVRFAGHVVRDARRVLRAK